MAQEINIQEFVDEITQPNVECVIDNEVPEDEAERFGHIVYSLITIIRQCIRKQMLHPYLHIKDVNGNFLFNSRLVITESPVNIMAMDNLAYCDIHLIKKGATSEVYYCATTPDTLADNNRFYLNRINFTNGVLDRNAYEKATQVIIKMIRKNEHIAPGTPMDASITVHHYEPESKVWEIESYRIGQW